MPLVFTIGHSTRTAEEFVALLHAHGIRRLVDVRRAPGSRRHPHFGRDALAATLAAAGIAYRHEEAMGGRRLEEGDLRLDSPNGGWKHPAFRAYADHLATPAFSDAVARLLADAKREPTTVMCAEARPGDCHRQLIADALVARGVEVRHILSADAAEAHVLNPMAVVGPGGRIAYPPGAPGQTDLFG
jgi:uncharacterized protein (DUF488 family)